MEIKDKVEKITELLKGESYSNSLTILDYVKREISENLTLN